MKSTLLGAVALLALPFSVQAGALLPNLYAQTYCDSRAQGMSKDDATTQAVSQSYISSGNPPSVTWHGVKTTTDVVASAQAAMKLCPQYFS